MSRGSAVRIGLLSSASVIAAFLAFSQAAAQTSPDITTSSAQPSPQAGTSQDVTPDAAAPGSPVQPAGNAENEVITVTGTRIKRDGYSAPTPETVVGAAEIARAAPNNIADLVNDLPQAAATSTPRTATVTASSGSAGSNFLNLRGLGANRTLVLLDGRRFVGASLEGLVDVNTLPSTLVSRVDVVTGGASAAYGSDAVAGVVNFVLDTRFTGLKTSAQAGLTEYGDGFRYRADLAGGASFADSRGHVLASVQYSDSKGVLESASRPWFNSQKIIPNPAFTATNGQPQLIKADNVNIATATYGGLITSGVLRGTQFLQGGAYAPYTFGTISSPYMIGGTSGSDLAAIYALELPVQQFTAFGRASFDFSDAFKVFVEASYADSVVHGASPFTTTFFTGNLVLQRDNAFLPDALRSQLVAAGQTSFNYGTYLADIGRTRPRNEREVQRYVAGLDGDLGGGWSYNVYGQYGRTNVSVDAAPNIIVPNFRQAVDSVRNAAGQIVCRVNQAAVVNPACVPYNPFGIGVNSPAAVAYVSGDSIQRLKLEQTVAAATIQGQPFSTWAGPLSFVAGAEYRKEKVTGTSDALSQANAFGAANYKPTNGSYDVKEAFVEVVVPLARDVPFIQSLDLNGAFRRTDYSTSGAVSTWKVGGNWVPIDGIRFRATRSRDIRAPNLNDLFLGGVVSTGVTVRQQSAPFTSTLVGSQALTPEIANTLTGGVVLQPRFAPGLSLSFDYYRIKIQDSIVTLTNQQIVDLCAAGTTALCNVITRNAAGTITAITRSPTNIAREVERGFDIEATYRHDLSDWIANWDANVTMRVLATHIITRSIDNGLLVDESAGENSGAIPDWRVVSSLTYEQGPFTGQFTARTVSSGVYDKAFTSAILADNRIPGATYFDLGLSVKVPAGTGKGEFFINIDNVFNKDPVIVYPQVQQFIFAPVNAALYDTLGREFRAGFRVQF